MKRKLLVLLFTLALAAWCAAQTQNEQITAGPTVEGVTGNSATIAWSTNTGGSSVVRYGADPNNLNQAAQSPWAPAGQTHRVQLTNLQPGATYYYQVLSTQGQGTGTGALSNIGQFTTPGTAQPGQTTIPGQTSIPAQTPFGAHVPVYRAYTANTHVWAAGTQPNVPGVKQEGVAFYVDQNPGPGEVPLYHLSAPNGNDFLTASSAERDSTVSGLHFRDQGVLGYIATTQQPGTVPLYHLFNQRSNQHFFTASSSEHGTLLTQGWRDQGITGYVWTQ